MKETYKATVKKIPAGLQAQAQTRSFSLLMDEPKSAGGTDEGMTPVEAVLCGLGACQTICAYAFAKGQGIKLRGFYSEVEADLDPDGFMGINPDVRNGFSEVRFTMHFDTDNTQEEVEKFADFIESRCPVGDIISNAVPMKRLGVVID